MKRFEKMMRGWSIWKKRISAALACIVVFVTVYAMVLPAITLDQNTADDDQGIVFDTEDTEDSDDRDLFDDSEDDGSYADEAEKEDEDSPKWSVELHWPDDFLAEKEETSDIEEEEIFEETEKIDYSVTASFTDKAGLSPDAVLRVREIKRGTEEYKQYCDMALGAVSSDEDDGTRIHYARFFDISFLENGVEVEPTGPVNIVIDYKDEKDLDTEVAEEVNVVHFPQENEQEPVLVETVETEENHGQVESVTFDTNEFSVYGVVGTYTVDFEYEVDGAAYDFSLEGGGFVSFTDLVEVLGILDDAIIGQTEAAAKKFVAEVEDVEFSDPSLVWVGKTDGYTTIGALKEENGLECQYSSELTAETIEKINSSAVEAGDWALISMQPFTSEETLTVTMKNEEQFTVKVTDAQITTMYLSDAGKMFEVTVSFDDKAEIPDDAELNITEFDENSKEYLEARTALVEKRVKEDEFFNDETFGMTALDISILDRDGNEIEPRTPVQVSMKVKSLPGVEDIQSITETLRVDHLVDREGRQQIEEMVSQISDTSDGSLELSFETPSFSTFTASWGGLSLASVNGASSGQYIIFAKNPADGKYYALTPTNPLRTVEVEIQAPGEIIYNGNENLYWTLNRKNVTVNYASGPETLSGYQFYFDTGSGYNSRRYYLTWSESQGVYLSTTEYGYNEWNGYGYNPTGTWLEWSGHLYSAYNCFLRYENGQFTVTDVTGDADWEKKSLVYLGKNVTPGSVQIKYEDENGEELTISNEGQPEADNTPAYLIYDIDNYEYDYTYLGNDKNNKITPILNMGGKWQYTTGKELNGDVTWTDLNDGDVVHVVYKPKTKPTTGGVPKPGTDWTKPANPVITKTSKMNGDGTNTLALSVTAPSKQFDSDKLAEVIVILDVSGSMRSNMDGEWAGGVEDTPWEPASERRISIAKEALYELSDMLLRQQNTSQHNQLIRMSLYTFSNIAQGPVQDYTFNADDFDTTVENLSDIKGGTNWEHALKLANLQATDPDRATYVIFVTDGEPTFRLSREVLSNGNGIDGLAEHDVSTYYYGYNVYGAGNSDDFGRNYAAALKEAKAIVNSNKSFYTIGISNDVQNLETFTDESGAGDGHSFTANSEQGLKDAFEDIGRSILATAGYSSISIDDGITDLSQIVQKSDLVNGDVNFDSDSFTYYKGKVIAGRVATQADVDAGLAQEVGGTVVESWESWDPASENCNPASYNSATGAVEWHMGNHFMPEDGYTYQVRFRIWPSQEAYDLLADLNNGVKAYNDLEPEVKQQIKEPDANSNGQYTLKTNTDTGYSWREATKVGDTITPTSDPTEPVGFEDVDPLYLEPKPLKIKKQWDYNYVDSRLVPKEIDLELFGVSPSGQLESDRSFRKIKLKEENGWYDENNFVSYGLVTLDKQHPDSPNTKIYETGHDFTLRELGENAHYYELSADIFRPMVINGTSTVLMRVDQPSGMEDSDFYYTNGRNEYYRLDGKVYMDVKSDVLLLATNTHRSFMDLTKVLDDMEVPNPAPEFQYEIKFTIPEEIRNNTSLYEEYEKYIWFSVYDPVQHRTLAPNEYTHSNLWTADKLGQEIGHPEFSGPDFSGYLIAFDGETFTLNIKPGWNVRFLNLPVGTTYEFKETNIPNEYEFRSADVSGTVWNENTQSARQINGLPVNDGSDLSNTVISSTIEMANARYKTTYHNGPYTLRKSITVTKQWSDVQQNNHSGDTITFTLYQKATDENGNVIRDSAYTGPYDNTITGSGTVTIEDLPASGKINGTPVDFTYYVEETAGVTGYDPVISHTEGSEGTPDAWTIENVKRGSNPRTTSVPVTKKWMENGQDVTGSHTLDEITVRLTQKILDTGYVPVTLTLKDADNTTNRTENLFIKKGQVTFTASRSQVGNNYPDNYGITLTVNGNGLGSQSGSSGNYQFEVTGPVSMTAALNGSKRVQTGFIIPVTTTYYERWSNKNNSTSAVWSPTLTDTLATEDAVFAAAQNGSIGTELSSLEYTYTFSKDSLTGGIYPATAEGWNGTISDLPLFSQAPDGTYYYYTYTIDEIAVNGNPVNNGDTVGYTVSVDQTSGTITNTRKPPIDVTIRKVDWADLDNMSADTLSGAEFTLEKYTDSNYAIEDTTWTEQSDSDSNDDGIFTFTGLYEGYYQLVETAIPEGYVKTSEDPKFHVKEEEGQLKIYIIDIDGTEKLQGSIMKVENHTINVGNVPGASLPYTGGMGTRRFTILGSILIGGAGLLLWRRRRYI